MMNAYDLDSEFWAMRDLLKSNQHLTAQQTARIDLFVTYCLIQQTKPQDASLDHFKVWLVGFGFPEKAADFAVSTIRDRLAKLNTEAQDAQ